MPLRLGATAISTLRLGTATPSKVMLGTSQVWPGALPWTPLDLAGLGLFLDGSDALTIIVSGDKVTEWRDKSPLGRTVTNTDAATQPSPIAQGIQNGALTRINDMVGAVNNVAHFFLIGVPGGTPRPPNEGVAYYSTYTSAPENYLYDQLLTTFHTEGNFLYQPTNNGLDATARIPTSGTGGAQMIAGYWDAASGAPEVRMWRNSTDASPVVDPGFPLLSYAGTRTLAIGRYMDGTPNFASWSMLNGSMNCIVICSAEAMRNDRLKLEGWAAHAFGQTALLPGNHPYKNAPPTK